MLNKSKDLGLVIGSILLTLLGVWYIFFYKEQPNIVISIPGNETATATIPAIDKPGPEFSPAETENKTTGNLIFNPYVPSKNVYTSDYNKELIRLALDGNFKSAKILMKGKIIEPGKHFLSFNFDSVSGVLDGSRKSVNLLDVDATQELGGVYQGDSAIEVDIDLFSDTILSTTKDEFIETKRPSKIVNLWDLVGETPSVINFLFAPFNEQGVYGGIRIDSIEFLYTCEKDQKCSVERCANDELYTVCLKNNFGLNAAIEWCDRTRVVGCEKIK